MSTKTEKELEQKYLDNVIDKVKQAEQKAEEKQDSEIANARKTQVGSGDRSEKIKLQKMIILTKY